MTPILWNIPDLVQVYPGLICEHYYPYCIRNFLRF